MKNFTIKFHIRLFCLIFVGFLISCDEEDDFAAPEILNVRITDPAKADSSLVGGGLGQMVVVQGRNLASVQELYFNSEPAYINTTLITDTDIIAEIPAEFPKEITNQIRLITKGGTTTYDFVVDVPGPVVENVKNEFAPASEEAVIFGKFFYNVQSVTFNGLEATIVEESPNQLSVIVPEGDISGPIVVTSVAGQSVSSFNFRDNTGIVINFDDAAKCWGDLPVIETSEDITATSGNFGQLNREGIPAQSWWDNGWVAASCGALPSTGSANEWMLEFEMNVPEEWVNGRYEIGLSGTWHYLLKPWDKGNDIVEPYTTEGWITIRIPLSEFRQKVDGSVNGDFLTDASGLTDMLWNFQNPGPDESTVNLNFDNIRIVKAD